MDRYLLWALRVTGLSADLLIVWVGVLTLLVTPPSVEAGLHAVASHVWSGLLIGGGLLSAAGVVMRRLPWQIVGALVASSGFFTWALSAVLQPDPDSTTYAVAAALAVACLGLVWRAVGIAYGSVRH